MNKIPEEENIQAESNAPESSEEDNTKNDYKHTPIKDFIQDFIKGKNKENDILVGLESASNVFLVDARTGGNYFHEKVDIAGDIIGNNQKKPVTNYLKSTSIQEIAGQISDQEIRKIDSVYIHPPLYSDAKSILGSNNILIIWGNLNLGKRTTAIHLIWSVLKSENIFEVDPTIKDFVKFQAENNQGYIIDQLDPDSAINLNKYYLNHLSNHLKNKKSYLIITIDKTINLSSNELSPYIIRFTSFLDQKTILQKHLSWYLGEVDLAKEFKILQETQIQELLETNRLLPGDIDRLAQLLLKCLKQELTLDEALAHFGLIANQQVESWFDQHSDLSQRTFMITLAVLNGSPYQIVVEGSQQLTSIIKTPSEEEKMTVAETKLSQRLREFSAVLEKNYKNTEYGQSLVELIVFKNSAFQPAILSHIWQEYDQYRLPILSWLKELGSHSNSTIQLKASFAVGELCKYDFGIVQERVLKPWANSENQNLQRLAALALSIPVFDGSLAPQVLKLLHHWSKLDNNPRLRWVATVAYGGYVGLRFPEIALRDLLVIAESQDELLFLAVVQSLVSLFEMGKIAPNQYLFVLATLQLWTDNPKKTIPHHLGLLTFWFLMSDSQITEESSNTHLPTLLWLAKENNSCHKTITFLIRRALNMKSIRQSVLKTIHDWLELVSYDHRLYPTIGKIIYQIVKQGDNREKERIIAYLKRWGTEKPPHDNAAWKILSVLKKDEHLSIK